MSNYEDGVAAYKKRQDKEAAALFRKALEENPEQFRAAVYLALTLERVGDLDAALGAARLATGINGGYAKGHNALGNIHRAMGNLEEALTAYRAATKIEPAAGMKAARMRRPSSPRMGMFCRLGSLELSRPVAAPVWLKMVCTRPVSGFTAARSAST